MITDIKEKLADMQAKYIDKQSAEDNLKTVYNCKTTKIKKKLASLEVERCHKLLAKEDVTAIDKKFASKKNYFLTVVIRKVKRNYAFIISFACSSV
jgi:hypothetical protein